MTYKFWNLVSLWVIMPVTLYGGIASGQTLFKRPDTLPNYTAYKYPDQCLAAVRRTVYHSEIKDSVWYDTASYDPLRTVRPIPQEALKLAQVCLTRISVDSIPVKDYDIIVPVLLLADRDKDVSRLVNSAMDKTSGQEKVVLFNRIMTAYNSARPKRLALLEELLSRDDGPFKTAALEGGEILSEVIVATMALDLGQTEYPKRVVRDIMNKDGKYANKLSKVPIPALVGQVYPLVVEVLADEGMDSLAKSTHAYRRFLEGVWSHLSDQPFSELNGSLHDVSGVFLPAIRGAFWYTNLPEGGKNGEAVPQGTVVRINDQIRPLKGKINVIMFLQGGCHSESSWIRNGRNNGSGGTDCWKKIALIKRLKEKFHDIEITVVSKTFGSIGNAPPLQPNEEADTLAQYFLGFHKIPGVHVIAQTDFIRMTGYDRRRLDLEVDYEEDLLIENINLSTRGYLLFVDSEGLVFHSSLAYPDRLEPLLEKKLDAVMKRQGSLAGAVNDNLTKN